MFANTYHLEVEKLVSFCESVMRRNMEMSKLLIFVDFNFLVKPCFPFHDAEFKLFWSVKPFLHGKIKLLKRTKSHELAHDVSCKKQSHKVWAFLITDRAIVRRITLKRCFWMAESYLTVTIIRHSTKGQTSNSLTKRYNYEDIQYRKNLLTTDAWIWLVQENRMRQATKAGESP